MPNKLVSGLFVDVIALQVFLYFFDHFENLHVAWQLWRISSCMVKVPDLCSECTQFASHLGH